MAERNVPTPQGRQVGEQLARLCDKAEASMLAELGTAPYRCASCAFRRGTFPNGCPETVLDALKCVMEGVPFYCHHSEKDLTGKHIGQCAGYVVSRAAVQEGGLSVIETPWPFSHEAAR
jgi:hypothetical protein